MHLPECTSSLRAKSAAAPWVLVVCIAAQSASGNDGQWDASPGQPGMDNAVHTLYVFNDPDTNEISLLSGGTFSHASDAPAQRAARWTGVEWAAMDAGMPLFEVSAFTNFDAGDGSQLFAFGMPEADSTSVARWDGASWSIVPGAPVSWIGGVGVFEANGVSELYLSGGFFHQTPNGDASYIARWNGRQWSPVGDPASAAHDMLVWNDGSGPSLFAAGSLAFDSPSGFCGGIGRWDGSAWNAVGGCGFSLGNALATYDDSNGEALFMGGWFTHVSGVAASNIARWDGNAWAPLGLGVNGQIHALAVFDDGTGPALYAAGEFTEAGGKAANNIARWDGSTWSPLGEGVNGIVHSLIAFENESGQPVLAVAGEFTMADGQPANRVAFWRGPQPQTPGDLNGDGVVDVSDLLILLAAWGPCPQSQPCPADLNGDGAVDVSDLLLLLANWG